MKRMLVAMIIGLAIVCPAHAQLGLFGGDGKVKLPDPTTFAVRMESGDVDKAREWLEAGLDPDFMGSRIGSGLMIAAWEGNIELMRLFISKGADINKANANGETPILLASWKGKQDAVKWLLERGARINAPARQWSALHYAVFAGHKDLTRYLIDQGADINAQSTNGSSVLMMATYEGHEDLAKLLMEKGADRTVKNDWGDGALEWAMRFNRLQLARMVTNPEEFNIAISEPKEKWGEARRSLRMSSDLEQLLQMRKNLVERGMSTKALDNRIAAERVRIVRQELKQEALPPRAATLEITAKRKAPQEQSAAIVTDGGTGQPAGKAGGFKVPAATYYGTPKMPPKGNVKNY